MIKKAEDAEVDAAEPSAIKMRVQQQPSNALVVADPQPANGPSQLGLVKMPSMSSSVVRYWLLLMPNLWAYSLFVPLNQVS